MHCNFLGGKAVGQKWHPDGAKPNDDHVFDMSQHFIAVVLSFTFFHLLKLNYLSMN